MDGRMGQREELEGGRKEGRKEGKKDKQRNPTPF